MCYFMYRAAMPRIKKRISLGLNPVDVTDESVMITYGLDGNMRFYDFLKGQEGAEILYQRDIICHYEGVGSSLKMYRKKTNTSVGKSGVPLMMEYNVEFTWEDLKKLCGYELIDLVANWEYEITGRLAGFFAYKPKPPIRDMERQAYWPVPGQSQSIVNTLKAA